ncbi:MAG: DUF7527 domain-containing protein [Halobacteriota archaeon]
MQSRTVEQVESWDARPFSGGVRELHELADDDFSGTVIADDTWVFFLNGRVIGVFQGDIEDLRETTGTIYTAPDPSLPLLFTMQERGGKTQAKYFTNDTSIESADATLRDANFTGYLELSENVLSGDYYVTYYGGKSMSTAFIGQSERLEVGDEAFEMANDEVGVFEVRKVSMTITELPALPDAESSSATTGVADTGRAGTAAASTPSDEPEEGPETEDVDTENADSKATQDERAEPSRSPVTVEEAEPADDGPAKAAEPDENPPAESGSDESAVDTETADAGQSTADAETADAGQSAVDAETADTAQSTVDIESVDSDEPSDETTREGVQSTRTDRIESTAADPESSGPPAQESQEDGVESADSESMTDHERAVKEWATKDRSEREEETNQNLFREEAQWRKTKSIPALDPEESATTQTEDEETSGRRAAKAGSSPTARAPAGGRSETKSDDSTRTRSPDPSPTAGESAPSNEANPAQLEKLEAAVEKRDRRIESLESELSAAESERKELDASVAELREERAELQDRLETLESKLESAEQEGSAAPVPSGTDIVPDEALAGTNLFVRYDSKGKATLDSLADSSVDPEAVNENLRLDHHTQFDAEETTVEGTAFEQFLHDSSRYRFVDWLVRELPYELVDSGATAGLQDVYDAISAFDRVEFGGTVDVESESGETATHAFDVVIRDRMGEPLVVADMNDSRDPVPEESMDRLVSGATDLGETVESLAGAFYVTASYFEPGALERAQAAASAGGFFSRSDRQSYVKVSRKNGYHLCLVEDRRDAFHLTVPEL